MTLKDIDNDLFKKKEEIKIAKDNYHESVANAVQEYIQALQSLYQTDKFSLPQPKILSTWHGGYTIERIKLSYSLHLSPEARFTLVRNSPNGLFQQRTLEESIEGDFNPELTKDRYDPRTQLTVNETVLKILKDLYISFTS